MSGLNNPFGLCFSTHFVLLYEVEEEDVVLVSESDDDCLSGADMIIILQTTTAAVKDLRLRFNDSLMIHLL